MHFNDCIPWTFQNSHCWSYLGSTLTSDSKCSVEIRYRIAMTKKALTQKIKLLTNKNLSLKTTKNLAKSYVWSILLYGCETWTLAVLDKKKLETMEIWI